MAGTERCGRPWSSSVVLPTAGLATATLAAFLEALLEPRVAGVLLHDLVPGLVVLGCRGLNPADPREKLGHRRGEHLPGLVLPFGERNFDLRPGPFLNALALWFAELEDREQEWIAREALPRLAEVMGLPKPFEGAGMPADDATREKTRRARRLDLTGSPAPIPDPNILIRMTDNKPSSEGRIC
jgi:hypothetical protein